MLGSPGHPKITGDNGLQSIKQLITHDLKSWHDYGSGTLIGGGV